MFFALGDPWMIHFDPRYCLDLPSSTIRLVTTFRFLWHELQSLALVELTGWNMLKQMKLKRVETDEVETWCLFKKLWFASRYRIWRQQNRGSTHIMPKNWQKRIGDILGNSSNGINGRFKLKKTGRLTWERQRSIGGLTAQKNADWPNKNADELPTPSWQKKSVADRHHGFHIKQADADGCWFPPDREHVFLTYHPETKNGLAPKCPSIYY